MTTRWIIEGKVDARWPVYTRGNVGEVFPEVITALGYELGVVPAEAAWRKAYEELGVASKSDFESDEPVILGLFGGYTYLNLSYLRMLGVRAPGSSAEAIDVAFFGEGNPPPYVPRKGDKSILSSVRILRTVLKALSTKALPPVVADSFTRVAAFESKRPALDAPQEELLDYLFSFPAAFGPVFGNHMQSTAIASIVSGVLSDAATAASEPGLVTHLIGAAGDVRSAQYSQDLYQIAKIVAGDSALCASFDLGIEGLFDRLQASDTNPEFAAKFSSFLTKHGHRGPNDWELSSRTWDNTPELALAAVEVMRKSETDLSPASRLGDNDAKQAAAIGRIRPHLSRMERGNFDKAIKAMPYWAQAREATRDRAVRVILPVKQVFHELVRRAAANGGEIDPVKVALLYPKSELRPYLADPSSMRSVIDERAALHRRFSNVVPPFFITSQSMSLSLEELEETRPEAQSLAEPGDVLRGDAGSSGVSQGVARVILDPSEGAMLEPGEVLVAPLTDPSWTPLFLPAAAVVVNVGALMSHAVIVARELGIPCVIAVEGATERIKTGSTIEVDGTSGTVTVLD